MLILGCGDVGRRVAQAYLANGESVVGVARRPATLAWLDEVAGGRVLNLDLGADDLERLPSAGERVFHLAPPPPQGDTDPLTARLLDAFRRNGHPRRLVYISTTGVYGDCDGAWVDETWPVRPGAPRALRRCDAERQLQQWCLASGAELVILRVAGIYGPGRLPLARIRGGEPVVCMQDAPWSNRIHVDDLVDICIAAMERAPSVAIYNVCDGHPSTMTQYFCQVADAVGLPRPPQIPLADAADRLSPGMLSYLRESRRLSNRKLLDELGVVLRYPTLEEGLKGLDPRFT